MSLDPDPRHVDEDEPRRHPPEPDRSGMVIVYAAGGILLVLILVAVLALAASRSGPDPTTPQPGASGAIDLLDASPPVTAGTSGPSQSGAPRLEVVAQRATPFATAAATVRPTGQVGPPSLAGVATWYNAPSSRDAAAGPGLRRALGRHWRGTTVRVCAGDRCLTTRLTDWCLCSHGDRVIDLDDRAFRQLAPLSAGVVRVTVTVAEDRRSVPTAPPTDVRR